MDEEISIIDAKTRNEKIRDFLINNKKRIIIFLIIVIIIFLSFFGFKINKDTKKKQISEVYNKAVIYHSNGDLTAARDLLSMLVREKDPTYSPLALYFIIDNNLKENQEVNNLFDILINKTSLEDEIKNLIIYKKALYNADTVNENDLLKILNPLINSKSVWKSHGLYLVAEYYFAKNEKEKSKEFFNKILLTENANQEILKETQKRLNRDLSE
jgi:predicted negative regulator of RcsB-dependent stress response